MAWPVPTHYATTQQCVTYVTLVTLHNETCRLHIFSWYEAKHIPCVRTSVTQVNKTRHQYSEVSSTTHPISDHLCSSQSVMRCTASSSMTSPRPSYLLGPKFFIKFVSSCCFTLLEFGMLDVAIRLWCVLKQWPYSVRAKLVSIWLINEWYVIYNIAHDLINCGTY